MFEKSLNCENESKTAVKMMDYHKLTNVYEEEARMC